MADKPALEGTELEWQQIGERLREAREYIGLSQESVADHLDIPRPAVSAIENGKRKVSSVELQRLARLYRQPYAYFLGEEPEVDETTKALFHTTQAMSARDKQQVLRFAQFLKEAGPAPRLAGEGD